jgi:hypothetical protein
MVGGRSVLIPHPAVSLATARRGLAAVATARALCTAVPILLGWLIWFVYQPGIVNVDGIWIYAQAVRRTFEDWQPVYIAIVLSWLVPLGLKLWHVTLTVALASALGVQRLSYHTVRTLAGVTERTAHVVGLVTLLVLLTPLTPLAYYLVYFGSDGLLIPVMLWFAVLWLSSYERFPASGRAERTARAGTLTLLAAAAVLIRPNAVVLLPVFAGLLVAMHGRGGRRSATAWCLLLLAVRPAASAAAYSCYRIDKTHPEDQVMALDLVGITILRPEALADLPFTTASLDGDRYTREYAWGVVDPLYPWGHAPIVKPGFARDGHDRLTAEYREAAIKYPGTLALVKLRAFAAYLLEPAPFWHNTDVDPNDIGLFFNPKRRPTREVHFAVDRMVYANPVLQWVSVRHVLWLGVTGGLVGWLGYAAWRRPGRRAAGVLLMLLVPLGYYLSFALAVTTNHFRFMYPSTLVAQAVAVGLLVNGTRRRLAEAAERVPT